MGMSVQAYGGFLNAATLFEVACAACKRLQTVGPSHYKNDALVSIVFSAATIEAFLNELPGLLSIFPECLQDEPPQVPVFVKRANELITNWGSTKCKYLLAYSVLSGQRCDKGGPAYQNFSLLIEARNGLMHAKSGTFSGEADPDGKLVMGVSDKLLERFRASGIIDNSAPSVSVPCVDTAGTTTYLQSFAPLPWNLRIATPKAAFWACGTAAAVVDSIVKIVPNGPHKPNLLAVCKGFKPISTG